MISLRNKEKTYVSFIWLSPFPFVYILQCMLPYRFCLPPQTSNPPSFANVHVALTVVLRSIIFKVRFMLQSDRYNKKDTWKTAHFQARRGAYSTVGLSRVLSSRQHTATLLTTYSYSIIIIAALINSGVGPSLLLQKIMCVSVSTIKTLKLDYNVGGKGVLDTSY